MMLWNIIRDWFVQYIFGGFDSTGNYFGGVVGIGGRPDGHITEMYADDLLLPLPGCYSSGDDTLISYISMGDWLSTTATIITLVLLVVMLLALVRFIVRQVSGLFAKI